MVKLSDVAKATGVSVATVSNAFTGKGRMSDEKKEKILQIAKEMGYEWTQRKSSESTANFIVIVEGFSVTFIARMLEGICSEARELNMQLPIYCMNIEKEEANKQDVDSLNEKIDAIIEGIPKTINGVIYVSQYARVIEGLFKKYCFQTISLFCNREKGKKVVHYDDFQGARIAVDYLIKKKCEKIAMIGGPIDSIGMFHRSSGYQRAFVDNKLSYNPQLVYVGDWNKESGYTLAQQLLEEHENVDGIFVQNDLMALGVYEAIQKNGFRCPEDIALIGFDNHVYSQVHIPAITTVNPPFEEMGREALRKLIQLTKGEMVESSFLPCELIVRSSG